MGLVKWVMALIVQKYGGTSVGSVDRIQAVAQRVIETVKAGHSLVVIVSAMGKTTDGLVKLAHGITPSPSRREMDMLLSTGEQVSIALVSMALQALGQPAVSLTGAQVGIVTEAEHTRARILTIQTERIERHLGKGEVVVVAGFQGVSSSEALEITTLGRGGSDTSAVALAAALRADCCEIYTDVPGILTADPRLVEDAQLMTEITCDEMLEYDAGRNIPLWKLAAEYEMARGNLTEAEVIAKMVEIVRILRRSIQQGIAGTHYEDRVLGHQCGRFDEMMRAGKLLDGGALNRIILYVTALMEVKSSMGVIVAAPTAGACAALPGAIVAMAEAMDLNEEAMAKALLASGLIGVFIATRWTFAAEVGGCQAEGGSAASMAAAAMVTLAGGSLTQSVAAASMALQSMIGLICDPVANRVEVPCLGKNVMAASNALSCANMALAGYDPVIPLDEVIDTAKHVATQMPREVRCTNLGGLSITPTAIALEEKLAARRASACGVGCGC